MYPILITLVIGLLLFGLIFSLFKASRQAQVSKSEQSGNAIGKVFWIYVFWALLAFGGALLYGIYRL
ncbi:hypothetical protein [Pueribacillus sp. YX66]|uniref:hypothetical protein n=1 Tax=Pueribacillus sp. YX66 TaxID=3229242 RepID=UPI00358D1DC9